MFYCFIMITIALLLISPFRIRNKNLFSKSFGGLLESGVNQMALDMHNTMHNGIFNVTINFFNYTANLILKFIIFSILIIVLHFTETIIIPSVYLIYLLTSWHVYRKRKTYYMSIRESINYDDPLRACYIACSCIPTYHTILFALIEILYIFSL